MARVNIVTIVSDTLRYDHVGANQRAGAWTPPPTAYGTAQAAPGQSWSRTPNLDRFAERAVVFDQAWCGSFPTIPARTDLFTGRYTFVTRGWTPLPADELTLPQLLRRHGYVTQLIADTAHLFRADFQRVFDAWDWQRGQEGDRVRLQREPVRFPCDPRKLRADRGTPLCEQQLRNQAVYRHERDWSVARTIESACDWLEEHRRDSPFYLHVDLFDPHEAWLAPQWYAEMYDPDYQGEEVIAPDYAPCDYMTLRELQHARALYAAEVTLVDRWVGRLLDKLDDLGLDRNTAVFLFSDHGFYIGEHGLAGKHGIKPYHTWPFYPEVARIVCMAAVPEMASGRRCSVPVQLVDVVPTVLELARVAAPADTPLHGQSLVPLLERPEAVAGLARSIAVTSGALPVHPDEPVHSGTTDGRWLLIEAGPSRRAALFNLASDPSQEDDVLDTHRDEAERLHQAYLALLERAGTAPEKLALRRELVTSNLLKPATAIVPPERSSGRP